MKDDLIVRVGDLENAPKPIIPKLSKKKKVVAGETLFSILDFDALELARQLTLLDFSLFSQIALREFLDLNWLKETEIHKSPNLVKYSQWSSHIVQWLETEIVTAKDAKTRLQISDRIIMTAHVPSFFQLTM